MNQWQNNIRTVVPYVPGEQPHKANMIKLNTNENPYPPSPKVLEAIDKLKLDELRLYPDPTCSCLVDALAQYYHLDASQVFVGVGSDDVLAMAFLTFFNSDKPILFPDITYSFYKVWANLYRIPYETPALDDNFHIINEDYYKKNGGVIFPNPNAPTSVYKSLEHVEDIIKHNQDVIVIVDEAYIDFGGQSALELIHKYDNLLIVQTFSKSRSMAGMRIGFAMGQPTLIEALNNVKYAYNSYTMSQTALHYGAMVVKDIPYFKETLAKVIATREKVKVELAALGFVFPDSKANFIFAKHPKYEAKTLFEALKAKDIYVRFFNSNRINEYLRISIGTDDEMKVLIDFFKDYIATH